jgi:hypothetical protein
MKFLTTFLFFHKILTKIINLTTKSLKIMFFSRIHHKIINSIKNQSKINQKSKKVAKNRQIEKN